MRNYLATQFNSSFGHFPQKFFTVGGRFEILGNHTDHQGGLCLAATADLVLFGAVRRRTDLHVTIYSEGFLSTYVDLTNLNKQKDEIGKTAALIRGIAAYIKKQGYQIGGLEIYLKSQIPSGAGIASSAAFELFIATALNHLFNEQKIDLLSLCKAGQFAENIYYEKLSGLLDQIGVAFGGLMCLDFNDINSPKIEKLACDFSGYQFVIVNTKRNHTHLSPLYEAIVNDMRQVALYFNKHSLNEVNEKQLYLYKKDIINKLGLLPYSRAKHYFQENIRVKKGCLALKNQDIPSLITLMNESCLSSTNLLQNMYVDSMKGSPLEACELIKEASKQKAGVKINGGGFAGSVIALVPNRYLDDVVYLCQKEYGENNVYLVNVHPLIPSELI
ncbi:MAG: hypothetical protein GX813_00735 [Erysipelotrichia bacterium]|nr:hypothetical protein [Erysipelotrichia bacterium]